MRATMGATMGATMRGTMGATMGLGASPPAGTSSPLQQPSLPPDLLSPTPLAPLLALTLLCMAADSDVYSIGVIMIEMATGAAPDHAEA